MIVSIGLWFCVKVDIKLKKFINFWVLKGYGNISCFKEFEIDLLDNFLCNLGLKFFVYMRLLVFLLFGSFVVFES